MAQLAVLKIISQNLSFFFFNLVISCTPGSFNGASFTIMGQLKMYLISLVYKNVAVTIVIVKLFITIILCVHSLNFLHVQLFYY